MPNIDISSYFNDIVPVVETAVLGKIVQIRVFFSVKCCEVMIESHEKGDDYRSAFAKAVYYMYKTSSDCNTKRVEHDFITASDDTLTLVLNAILEQEESVKTEYMKIEEDDQYERFYNANKEIISEATKGVSKLLHQISKTLESLNKPLMNSFQSNMSNFNLQSIYMPQKELKPSLDNFTKQSLFDIPSVAFETQKIEFPQNKFALLEIIRSPYPELTSALSNTRQPIINLNNLLSPMHDMLESIQLINKNLAFCIQTTVLQIQETIQSTLSALDLSLPIFRREWNKQRETLLKYGWIYSDELPDVLVNNIYEKQDELTTKDVDKIIVEYFRQNRCKEIKRIVLGWNALTFFSCRSTVFHEAVVNHSRKYYNSSVMMITLQIEGVITDFVRLKLETPRFKVEKALFDIKTELKGSESISFYEYEVYNDIIEKIEKAFNEGFDCANPEKTSNQSRHKIAHGHAYAPETEVNSLKQFLYLNEVYHLLFLLAKSERQNT